MSTLHLDLEDVVLIHCGRACTVDHIVDTCIARCPHCNSRFDSASRVTTDHGHTNAGGTYGEVEVDMTIECRPCAELVPARIRWTDL